MKRQLFLVLAACCWMSPAWAGAILSDMEARFETVRAADGTTTVHLLAGGPLGDGGIAKGMFDADGNDGFPPEPIHWVAHEGEISGIEPTPFAPNGTRVLSFDFDRVGELSGIEPTPFRIYLVSAAMILGELDFSGVTDGALGSLIGLTGVTLTDAAGDVLQIEPFDVHAVPAPGGGLFVLGLAGLALFRRRARLARA